MTRQHLVQVANNAFAGSRYGSSAPTLRENSSRETVIRWLEWNDPNGMYSDKDCETEDVDPLTLEESWRLLAHVLDDQV